MAHYDKALVFDRRLSTGAFRLWHVLRDYAGSKLKCWPGQRTLCEDMGSNFETVAAWREELVSAGWLKLSKGPRSCHVYELVPLPTATETGSAAGSGSALLPKAVAVTATGSGSKTNGRELTKGTEGRIPAFERVNRRLYRREYEAMIRDAEAELKKVKTDPALRERILRKNAADFCKWLREEAEQKPDKKAESLRRATAHEKTPTDYQAGELTSTGQAIVAAWRCRIAEIRKAMNGQL